MLREWFRFNSGQSLIEIVVAVSLLALLVTGGATLGLSGYNNNLQAGQIIAATAKAVQAVEASRSIHRQAWNLTKDGATGFSAASGVWGWSGTQQVEDIFTAAIQLDPQTRDAGGAWSETGNLDVESKKISASVNWEVTPGRQNSLTLSSFLSNWPAKLYRENSVADFKDGSFLKTEVTGAGMVQLRSSGLACTKIIGGVDLNGGLTGRDFKIVNNSAYLVTEKNNSGSEFFAINISDKTNPGLLGELELGASGLAVVVSGNYAYVATDDSGAEIQVVNISNPAAPVKAANLDLGATPVTLAIADNFLYVGTQRNPSGSELLKVNLNDPLNLVVASGAEIGADVNRIQVAGGLVYLVTAADGGEFNIYDKINLSFVAGLDLPSNSDAMDLQIVSDKAYIATKNNSSGAEFYVIELAASPYVWSSLNLGTDALSLAISGNSAVVGSAQNNLELKMISLASLNQPKLVSESGNSGGAVRRLEIIDDNIFLTGSNLNAEFQIHQPVSNFSWACAQKSASLNLNSENGLAIKTVEGKAYLGAAKSSGPELFSLDITQTAPALSGSLEIDADVNKIDVGGANLFLATSDNSQELKVINSITLAQIGSYNSSGNLDAKSLVYLDNKVYLGTEKNSSGRELYLIDVSTPSSASFLASLELGETARDLAIGGNYLYVATGDNSQELKVIDISNSSAPAQVGSFNASGNSDGVALRIFGNTIFLITDNGSLYVLNISNPVSPVQTAVLNLNLSVNAIVGDEAENLFIGSSTNGKEIAVIDITDLAAPKVLNYVTSTGGAVFGMDFVNNVLFSATANSSQEFQIYKVLTGDASGFETSGTYVSSVIDSGSTATSWNTLNWTASLPGCQTCALKLEFRTAVSTAALSSAEFTGPDGLDADATDFFTSASGQLIHSSLNNRRYSQYRLTITGDGSQTPALDNLTITYSP